MNCVYMGRWGLAAAYVNPTTLIHKMHHDTASTNCQQHAPRASIFALLTCIYYIGREDALVGER